jgi:hypothetical protein
MSQFIIISIIIGSVYILVGLIVAVFKPTENPQVGWIVRVLVSLGAGFVAAGILGTIEISGTVWDISVHAGGPIAVFFIIYAFNPSQRIRNAS